MFKLKLLIEKLYHRDIHLPKEVEPYVGRVYRLLYTAHAQSAAKTDRYGKIDLSKVDKMMKVDLKDVVEAEIDDVAGDVTKLVIRKPYDEQFDIVIAFTPNIRSNEGTVRTVWLNRKSDVHKTLRTGAYTEK